MGSVGRLSSHRSSVLSVPLPDLSPLSISLTGQSTACLPACTSVRLSDREEFRSVSVHIPVKQAKTNATEKSKSNNAGRQLPRWLFSHPASLVSHQGLVITLFVYTAALYWLAIRSTCNNQCPVKGQTEQRGEGVLFAALSASLSPSLLTCVFLHSPANAIVIFLPASRPPAGPRPSRGSQHFLRKH